MIGLVECCTLLPWFAVTFIDDITDVIFIDQMHSFGSVRDLELLSQMFRLLWHSRPHTLKLWVLTLRATTVYCYLCKMSDPLYTLAICRLVEHTTVWQRCKKTLSGTVCDVFGMVCSNLLSKNVHMFIIIVKKQMKCTITDKRSLKTYSSVTQFCSVQRKVLQSLQSSKIFCCSWCRMEPHQIPKAKVYIFLPLTVV